MVDDRREGVVGGGIAENRVVPLLEVWVVGNELRECLPLIGRRNKTGTVGSNGGGARARRLEGILRPGQSGVIGGVECGGGESSGISLGKDVSVMSVLTTKKVKQ